MAGIIEYLKARRARGAGMLHPGKNSGSGSGLLLNSSSLQPQTVFRQTKASFSVKRPSMTILNMNRISSFSQNAESKYANNQSLMHLRPSTGASASTVQRAPASMPLPVSGGASAVQPGSENPVAIPSSPMSGMPSYPPKSERRPVVFDRSDGPSDLEKRIKAAKKQKVAQEAKQRGPDRRVVRTERVEISSSGNSGEIQREILDPGAESIFKKINRAVQQAQAGRQETNPEQKRSQQQPAITNSVQREMEEGEPAELPEFGAAPSVKETVRRELPTQKDTAAKADTIQLEPLKPAGRVPSVTGKPAQPIAKETGPAETIQREPLKTAEPVQSITQTNPQPAAKETAPAETIQREPLESAGLVPSMAEKPSQPIAKKTGSAEMIQREPLKKAGSVKKVSQTPSQPAEEKTGLAEIVQREPLKTAEPVPTVTQKPSQPAAKEAAPAGTVQREPLHTAEPIPAITQKPSQTTAKEAAPAETVQREPLHTSGPVPAITQKPSQLTAKEAAPVQTIQREPLKTAAPVPANMEKTDRPVSKEAAPAEIIQREPLDTAAPVSPNIEKADRPALKEAAPVETIQREPLKTAEPVPAVTEKPDQPSAKETVHAETIQREPLKTAKPVLFASETNDQPAPEQVAPAETIQREPLEAAEPAAANVQETVKPAAKKSTPAKTVQREPLKKAEPVQSAPEMTDHPATGESAPAETVQREPLKTAEPVVQTHDHTDMPLVQREEETSADTIQREFPAAEKSSEPAIKTEPAKPVSVKRDRAEKKIPSANLVQRSYTPERTLPGTGAAKSSEAVIQRETADIKPEQSGDRETVTREPDEDLKSLLSKLPTHYEMPKAQIDAIRSGKPYSSNSSSEENVVSRQLTDKAAQLSEHKNNTRTANRTRGADSKAAEASVQKTVQREPDLILPKQQHQTVSAKDNSDSTVQREIGTKSSASRSTGSSSGTEKIPQQSFGNNGFMGSGGFGAFNTGFLGGQPGLIQREPLETSEPDTVQRAPISTTDTVDDRSSVSESSDDIPKSLTAKELDTLADKLVPRIKRMMRAEMERNIFR